METELNNNDTPAAGMYKYPMKDVLDYRPTPDNHQVLLVKVENNINWAIGKYSAIDSDMIPLTDREYMQLESKRYLGNNKTIPTISLRQCRELLILTNRFDDVENTLASLPESTDEEKATKRILTNYWEYSTDFERDHKSLSLITEALGMSEDEVDDFFIAASKL